MMTAEELAEALAQTDLIQGIDWLGTGTRYPTDEETDAEILECAKQALKAFAEAEELKGYVAPLFSGAVPEGHIA